MIQWYNKSLFNWSCSFPDMSMLFLLGLLFPYIWFIFSSRKENKGGNQKPKDRQKLPGCNPVWLPIHSNNRERERERETDRQRRDMELKRYTFSEGWSVMGMGSSFWFLLPQWVEREKHKGIFCTFRNSDSRPSGVSEAYFHSCVLRVWPDPAAAHPPMVEGWL